MAQGRFLSKKVSVDKRLHDLSSDTSRLAFSWAITHLDRDGRIQGEPSVLKSIIFPRREDITIDDMEYFIREWYYSGLIVWYEAKGDKWIFFPGFKGEQIGMRYEREPKSYIPDPKNGKLFPKIKPEDFRKIAGNHPSEVKLSQVKLSYITRGGKEPAESETEPDIFPKVEKSESEPSTPPQSSGVECVEKKHEKIEKEPDPLYTRVKDWFYKHNPGIFVSKNDWKRETPYIKLLIEEARARSPTESGQLNFLSAILGVFRRICVGEDKHFLTGKLQLAPRHLMAEKTWPLIIGEYERQKGSS